MSYDLKRSHFSVILERKVATGSTITEEGVLLQATLDATTGEEVVSLATAASGLQIAGFAIRDNADNSTTSVVEQATVPASGTLTIQLSNNNLVTTSAGAASSLRVLRDVAGTAVTLVNDGVPTSGQVAVNSDTGLLTFHADEAGLALTITYRYNLTVAEARQLFFQRNINNEAGALFGQVGVGHGHGEIFTDQYDATIDWATVAVGAIH